MYVLSPFVVRFKRVRSLSLSEPRWLSSLSTRRRMQAWEEEEGEEKKEAEGEEEKREALEGWREEHGEDCSE